MTTIRWIRKPKDFMGENKAIHWLSEDNPEKWGLKEGDIFVREDWFDDKIKMERLRVHEKVELYLMLKFDIPYKEAHKIANYAEHAGMKALGIEWQE